jgi:ABC-type Mn2+/Zn2+ transport system permease subunit
MSFSTIALVASLMVGLPLSYLGLFVVLRRVTFVGAALGQLASAGVALGVLMEMPVMLGASLLTLLGVTIFSLDLPRRRVPEESWVAVAYIASGAAGVLLLNFAPGGEADMMSLLFGNILAFDPADIRWMLWVFGGVLLMHVLFLKEFLLVSFDPESARVMGYRVGLWNFLFFLSLGVAIAVAIRVAGVMLAFSYLVLPPMIGLLLCRQWRTSAAMSVFSGALASGIGVWASLKWDLPTGSAVVACNFALLMLALLIWKLTDRG